MIKSMTGYGKAEFETGNKKITIELKTLNSKQLDINSRIPALYREKDIVIRKELNEKLVRGKMDFSLYIENLGMESNSVINENIVSAYFEQLSGIQKKLGLPVTDEIMQSIMRLPDSVKTVYEELDEKELDSWMRLIRVLTHEIMNSIAPVTSLSESLSSYFQKEGQAISPKEVNEKMISTTIRGLEVIKEQGRGLITFVESYRKLTRLPKPEKKPIRVGNLFEKMILLNKVENQDSSIQLEMKLQFPDLEIQADEKMISQVLINLIKNSREALANTHNAIIELLAGWNKNGQIEICVKDNGPGIPKELLDEIFIPFFTTRENGSGIGLSLSRQILRLHGGTLTTQSVPEKETVFCMRFN